MIQSNKTKIRYIAFGNHSGYSQAAQDMVLALHRSGNYDIKMDFMYGKSAPRTGMSSERQKFFEGLYRKKYSSEYISVFHCIPNLQRKYQKTDINIGCATYETYNPPNYGSLNWIDTLNKNDAVITPSVFNYEVFSQTKIERPVFYVPHCLDINKFHPSVEPYKDHDKFTFLFFGSWRQRKGYRQLLEAWFREFSKSDNVQLLIKTDKANVAYSHIKKARSKFLTPKKESAPILFEDKTLGDDEIPSFIKSADCLVSPTLGEGFGLPGLQSMAVGIPVLITNFSGCKDYANDDTATLFEPSGFIMHDMMDNYPQFKNRKWAFITVSEIRNKMRYVLENYKEVSRKSEYARKFVENNFSEEVAVSKFDSLIKDISDA